MNPIVKNIILANVSVCTRAVPRVVSRDYILDRVAYLLRTGTQWSNLPTQGGSWKTVYHYFSMWSKKHVFEKSHCDLLRFYERRKPKSGTILVDTTFVKSVYGRDCVGKNPTDRARRATKVSVVTDELGTPLHLLFHPGNKSDCKTLGHLVRKASRKIDLRGSTLYADKGYDTKECHDLLGSYGIKSKICKKRSTGSREDNRVRVRVEHLFSWLDKYRRIILRYDGLVCHFRSFHFLAATQLTSQRL